jgi:hypothetical protein
VALTPYAAALTATWCALITFKQYQSQSNNVRENQSQIVYSYAAGDWVLIQLNILTSTSSGGLNRGITERVNGAVVIQYSARVESIKV